MATPTIVEVLSDADSAVAASVTTGAGTQVGDVLIAAFGNNYFDGAGMAAPTGTAGTWTQKAYGDAGVNTAHLRVYTRSVTSGGAQTVTVSPVSSEEVYLFVYVIRDWTTVDDGQSNASGTNTTNPVAPSATAVGADDLLLCFWQTGAPHGGPTFTAAPAGMTDLLQVADPVGPFSRLATARQTLAASGATGTRTATISAASQYAAASILIAGAGAGGGVAATGRAVAATAGLASARKVAPMSGRGCQAPASAGTVRKVATVSARAGVSVAGAASARKVSPATAIGSAAVASSTAVRKAAPATTRASVASAAGATARKRAPATSLSSASVIATCGVLKLATVSGRGAAALAAASALRKVGVGTGTAYAAAWSYRSQVASRQITAVCSASAAGLAAARKVLPASAAGVAAAAVVGVSRKLAPGSGATYAAAWSYRSQISTRSVGAVCTTVAAASATARRVLPASATSALAVCGRASAAHMAVAAGLAPIAATGRAQAGRLAVVTGRGVFAVATAAAARKVAPAATRSYVIAVPLQGAPAEEADVVGTLSASDGRSAHLATGTRRTAVLSSTSSAAVLNGGDE